MEYRFEYFTQIPDVVKRILQYSGGFGSLWTLVSYILLSVGLYTIAKRRGIHNSWLAWIPILNAWVIGCISDQYRFIARAEVKHKRRWLLTLRILAVFSIGAAAGCLVWLFVNGAFSLVTGSQIVMLTNENMLYYKIILGSFSLYVVFSVVYTIVKFICLYDLYLSTTPMDAVLLVILSVIFSKFALPILVFAFRNKDGGMPPRSGKNTPEQPQWNSGAPVDE